MSDVLAKILKRKEEEVAALKAGAALGELKARASEAAPVPSFLGALRHQGGPFLIAEVKKASPSKGVIRADFDPVRIAKQYESGGAACLSVLTDEDFFQGHLDFLRGIRAEVKLPLLRKDFIIDEAQVWEARGAGASAILLIAAALEPGVLGDLYGVAEEAGLDVLVEVHDEDELEKVEMSGSAPKLIGVNNRDLRTFEVDLATTRRLAPEILGRGAILVSESGIFAPRDVQTVREAGASAVLVGESLMRQPDPGEAARVLMTPMESETPS